MHRTSKITEKEYKTCQAALILETAAFLGKMGKIQIKGVHHETPLFLAVKVHLKK